MKDVKVQACRGLNVVLENTWVCFIGPNITGFMGLLLTSVKNTGNFDVEVRRVAVTYLIKQYFAI